MLRAMVTKQIGRTIYNFEVEGENFHAVGMELQKLSFYDVKECGLCKKDNLYLRAYITEQDKYEYIKICCANCKASVTFGKAKNQKDLYFLRKAENGGLDWQVYVEKVV